MTNQEIHAIIFDCDGTLVDSEPISLRVLVEMVAREGLDVPHEEAMERWAGCDLHETCIEIETRLGRKLPADFLDSFRSEQLSRLAVEVQPMAGAAELMDSIHKPRCVASNAPRKKVRLCLETTGLIDYFPADHLFSAYDVKAWKPRPDVFLHAAEQMGVAPECCAVVEDSPFGIEAGLAAGMQVFVLDPQGWHIERSDVQRVPNLSELTPFFN